MLSYILPAREFEMRLAEFIIEHSEEIAQEWEKFAATLLPDKTFSGSILRDGIKPMLKEIVADMKSAQTAYEQKEKSEGSSDSDQEITPAEHHALARVTMGISSLQLISEFRALRATVIRLWQKENVLDKQDVYDLIRFHEAIDQALTEATTTYSKKIEDSRNLFLGILGHDLRSPLGAVSGAAQLIAAGTSADRHASLANVIVMSAGRMAHMITDLLELTRVHLGQGLSLQDDPVEFRKICMDVLSEVKTLYPERDFKLIADDEIPWRGDEIKLKQVLSNLVGNAIQHGSRGSAITVTANSTPERIELRIHNEGKAIPPELQKDLFDCFVQGVSGHRKPEDNSSSLGLGLYIAKSIVEAHHGTITVTSTAGDGTTFIISFPKA